MRLRALLLASGLAAAAAARPAMAGQIVLSPSAAALTPGATTQLQLSVQLDTIPLGGYLFTLNYDTRTLTLLSLSQVMTGEFQDEFYQGPGAVAGSVTFQGLNDKSLLTPTGAPNLAIAIFQTTTSTAAFAGMPTLTSTVTLTAREAVGTSASTIPIMGASLAYQVLGDTVAPTTGLLVSSGTSFTDGAGQLYVATASLLSFSATDYAFGSFPPSGVVETDFRLDASTSSAPFQRFTSPFALGEGQHLVEFRSVDRSGNVEATRSVTVKVDGTAPVSQVSFSSASYVGSSSQTFITAGSSVSLAAQDPISNGVASGVGRTEYWLDASTTSASQTYVSSFILTAGAHTLAFRSRDNVADVESIRSLSIFVDTQPPATALIVNGLAQNATAFVVLSTDAISFAASDAGSGVARTFWRLDAGSQQVFSSTFSLAVGTHTLAYYSVDNVGLAEAVHVDSITSRPLDLLPPRTALLAGPPNVSSGTLLYVTASTTFSLTAVDDRFVTGDGIGVGVATTFIAVDTSVFSVASGTFTMRGPGVHLVQYYSVDGAGNVEVVRSSEVVIDTAPPVTTVSVGAPTFTSSSGTVFVATTTPISFAASDPPISISSSTSLPGSGVARVAVSIDSGPFIAVTTSVVLSEGRHLLAYQSFDRLGNAEALKTIALQADGTPPVTALSPSGVFFSTAGNNYASSTFSYALAAVDPISSGVASGIGSTRFAVDSSSFQVYAATFSLAGGAHVVTYQSVDNVGNLELPRSTTIFVDAAAPVSTITIGSPSFMGRDGSVYIATITPLAILAADPMISSSTIPGSGVARIQLSIDSGPFAGAFSSFTLTQGQHVLLFSAIDNVGNVESTHAFVVRVDSTPPISALVIGQPAVALSSTTILVSSQTLLAISAVDPLGGGVASGIRQTFDSINGGTYAVYGASFTLAGPDGPQTIAFYSQDNVLNGEVAKSSSVVLDGTPPSIALLSPSATQGGVSRVLKGKFPVLGSVFDQHLQSYVLDFAPGQNATTGYITIGTGNVAVSSGTLAVWDASKLSGWQTLRLTATDLVANRSVAAINVFVGDPGQLLILGNDDVFNMPQGVSVGPGGAIYVADTNNSRIAVFSSTGTPLASFGRTARDGDDLRVSTADVILNHPEGVFLDGSGDVFVADSNDNRVLELSTTGQVLLTLGRQKKASLHGDHDGGDPGSAVGEFNRPAGVAVGSGGTIYVADTLNNRVQVFSSTGAALLAFAMPAAGALPKGAHDHDADAVKDNSLGRPYGIAVDASGNIYVADQRGSRALEFSATGQLLLTIPIAGGQPSGIAVTPDGSSIFVSDRKLGQVFGFDALGQQTLVFGERGKPSSAQAIALRKPFGLALGPAGDLFIADRNGDRIKEVSLPTGQPTLVIPPEVRHDGFASGVLDQDSGGVVARSDNAGINVPPGALSNDLKIVVSTAAPSTDDNAKQKDMANKGMVPAYAPVQYYPEGTQFAKPVTLTLPYDPALIAQLGIAEDSLHINYWDPVKQQWQTFNSTVDKNNHRVTAQTTHFSLYQVMSGSATTQGLGVQATASNTVDTVQIACNPLRPDCRPIKFQNLPAGARLRIYTLTGALVRDIDTDGNGQATWDGTNQAGASVASGVYFVLAQGNGTKKTFKIAVEK